VTLVRTRLDQVPPDPFRKAILTTIVVFFKKHPQREYAFERCAGELLRMMDPSVQDVELTRFWRDGGRDGVGRYRIGTTGAEILVDFALEAKCKEPDVNHSSGVRETTRLISRLRYRQFGVFLTTSCVHEQAYQEIIEDGHPVLIVSGKDICDILIRAGHNSIDRVQKWLASRFSTLAPSS